MHDPRTEQGSEALDHPRRRTIHKVVAREPGLNWTQLQRKTGLSVGTLMFHLKRLEGAGAVVRKPSTSDNEVLFFTPENEDLWRDPRTRILFGNESTRRIAEIISENPGVSVGEIAEELEVTPAAVRYHISKLDDHRLLEHDKEGRRIHYAPTDTLADWVDRFG